MDRQILSEDNASFAYKGKAVDIKHVGRELGVRYVLEGTLQALKTHRREVVAQANVQRHRSHHDQMRRENRSRQPSSSRRKGPQFLKSILGIFADFRPQRGPHFGGRAVHRFPV